MNSQVSSTRYNCFRFSFLAQTVLTITTSSTSSAAVDHFSPYGTILLFHHLFLRNEKKRLEEHQCLLSLRHVIVITIRRFFTCFSYARSTLSGSMSCKPAIVPRVPSVATKARWRASSLGMPAKSSDHSPLPSFHLSLWLAIAMSCNGHRGGQRVPSMDT